MKDTPRPAAPYFSQPVVLRWHSVASPGTILETAGLRIRWAKNPLVKSWYANPPLDQIIMRFIFSIVTSCRVVQGSGWVCPLLRRKKGKLFIRKRLGFFFKDRSPSAFSMLPLESFDSCTRKDRSPFGVGVAVFDSEHRGIFVDRSTESRLAMLVPRVLGEIGILPVVALVA